MRVDIVHWKHPVEKLAVAWMMINTAAFHDNTISLILSEVLAFIIVAANTFLRNRRVSRQFVLYLLWIGSFVLFCFISYIWSVAKATHWSMMLSMLQIILVGSTTILYIDNGNAQEREQRLSMILTLLLIAALVLCVRMLISVPASAWGAERVARYVGLGNTGATYMLSYPALVALYRALAYRKRWYYALYVILTAFSMMSGARKGILITILGTVIIFVASAKSWQSAAKRFVLSVLISGGFLYAIMNIPLLYNGIGVRVSTMMQQLSTNSGDDSISTRLKLLEYAQQAFLQRPVLGAGLDAFRHINPLDTYAHNNFMEILACLGILGVLLYYSLPVATFFQLIRRTRAQMKDSALYLAIIACILACDFFTIWYYNENIQIYTALLFSVSLGQALPERKVYALAVPGEEQEHE